MNTESLLAGERTVLDRVVTGVVGLDERYVVEFRQLMFRKRLNKKIF